MVRGETAAFACCRQYAAALRADGAGVRIGEVHEQEMEEIDAPQAAARSSGSSFPGLQRDVLFQRAGTTLLA
jgi:hypothetical protein